MAFVVQIYHFWFIFSLIREVYCKFCSAVPGKRYPEKSRGSRELSSYTIDRKHQQGE